MRTILALSLLTTSISACATASSDVVCPSLPVYTLAFQREAAEELKLLPPNGAVRGRMMPD